jgi:hypothetical protein
MTALDPAARPTAGEVAERLDGPADVTRAQPAAVVIADATAPMLDTDPPAPPGTPAPPEREPEPAIAPSPSAPSWRRRLPRPSLPTAALAAVAALLAVVLLVIVTSGGEGEDPGARPGGAELPAEVQEGFDRLREAVG